MPVCTKCKKKKAETEFYKSNRRKTGLRPQCKECVYVARREQYIDRGKSWYRNNKEAVLENLKKLSKCPRYRERKKVWDRNSRLKKNYGLTLEEYDKMLKKQKGVCAICKQKAKRNHGNLVVDHCHDTGEVRGLLCSNCNSGIGLLEDDLELVKAAARYLKKYQK